MKLKKQFIVDGKKYWEDKYWRLYYDIEEKLKELNEIKKNIEEKLKELNEIKTML